jgi:hypothetical protein
MRIAAAGRRSGLFMCDITHAEPVEGIMIGSW